MADITTALKAIATANAALTALVGSRVHHGEAAQNSAEPYVTFYRISDIPGRVMGTVTLSGLRSAHFQFDSWGESMSSAKAVAAALFAAFDDYRGTSDTIVIDKILMEYGPEDTGEGAGEFRQILEARVNYRI
jgi:formyltetrahydrofolate synthetase